MYRLLFVHPELDVILRNGVHRQVSRSAATAPRMETLADLPVALKLPLDVTQPESIAWAVDCVLQRCERIEVLGKNAGLATAGAVEEICVEHMQKKFRCQWIFVVMGMIRDVAPHMRRPKTGRIVDVSSIAGRLVTPANGVDGATKFALDALSDAMRLELAPFGIAVALIEPGASRTILLPTVESTLMELFQMLTHRISCFIDKIVKWIPR